MSERIPLIYAELRNFLVMASSPETVRTFDEAIDVLDKYGVEEYMDTFEAVTFDDPSSTENDVVNSLLRSLRSMFDNIVHSHGLWPEEHVLMSQIVEIADAMYMLPYYEDQVILGSYMAEYDGAELAGEVLALLMPYDVEVIMAMFREVSEDFEESLRLRLSIPQDDKEVLAAMPEELQKFAKAYMAYKAVINNLDIYPDRILSEPAAIGMEYLTYLGLYQADKEGSDLDRKQPDQVGRDLLGMAYLSKDGIENPLVTVRKHLNELFGDIHIVTKINLAVTNLTLEVSHAQA